MSDFQKQAENLKREGEHTYQAKDYFRAAELFANAADCYQKAGDPKTAAEMKNNQSVALLMAELPEQALQAVQGTDQVFAEQGEIEKQAMALANQASAYEEMGKFSQAGTKYQQAGDLFLKIGDSAEHLKISQSISSLKLKQRDPLGAVFVLHQGLEKIEQPTLRQRFLKQVLSIPKAMIGR